MRSAGETKSGESSLVTFAMKSTMDRLALPSFHDGSASAEAGIAAPTIASVIRASTLVSRFTIYLSSPLVALSNREIGCGRQLYTTKAEMVGARADLALLSCAHH